MVGIYRYRYKIKKKVAFLYKKCNFFRMYGIYNYAKIFPLEVSATLCLEESK